MQVDHQTALQALFRLGVDTELEFHPSAKTPGPLMALLVMARREAIDALKGLVHVNPADPEQVRKLQNEVQRFLDLLAFVKGTLEAADEAATELEPEEQDEIRALILGDGEAGDEDQ